MPPSSRSTRVDAGGVRFLTHRRADNYCVGGHGESDRLTEIVRTLDGVPVVLCARIGEGPRSRMAEAGIEVIDACAMDYIETALLDLYADRNRSPDAGALSA